MAAVAGGHAILVAMRGWVGTRRSLAIGGSVVAALLACGDEAAQRPRLELLDPAACEECHPEQYREWLGSMHAYAADDPVFVAMNARGQRETGGELGDFCVKCHAPVAVALGDTKDGSNLDELPQHVKGVTCWFCHSADSIAGVHDNPIELATDDVLRGEIADPVDNPHHRSEYSPLFDNQTLASSQLCGSCHDIVNGHGVQLERTYDEWLATFYSKPSDANPLLGAQLTGCLGCHMQSTDGPIADFAGVKSRQRFDHRLVGIDVALTEFPDAELGPVLAADQLEHLHQLLDPSMCAGLCVVPSASGDGSDVFVWLHNETAGHALPSGAAQDRRMWVQLQAFDGEQMVLGSGVVGPQASVDAAAAQDDTLWLLGDRGYGTDGARASMFWEVARVESELLVVAAEAGLRYDRTTWGSRSWHVDVAIDRVQMEVHVRPIAHELVDQLVEDGLDPAVGARIPTHVPSTTVLEWTPSTAVMTDCAGPCVQSAFCFDNLANGECI